MTEQEIQRLAPRLAAYLETYRSYFAQDRAAYISTKPNIKCKRPVEGILRGHVSLEVFPCVETSPWPSRNVI